MLLKLANLQENKDLSVTGAPPVTDTTAEWLDRWLKGIERQVETSTHDD
jgi:hypothetical protein